MAHKILLIGGSLRSGNRGIRAMTLGAIRCLEEVFPGAEFAVLGFSSPQSVVWTERVSVCGRVLGVTEATSSFHKGVKAVLCTRVTRKSVRDLALLHFWWADVVVDLSEGDGVGDTYGLKVFLRHSLGKLIALHLGKPLVVFPQTIGPFRTLASRALASYLLRRASLVCVRERVSEAIVRNLIGPDGRVVCLADMAFVMEPADVSGLQGLPVELLGSPRPVGVNVSGFLWSRAREMYADLNANFDYREALANVVRRITAETGRAVILIPHVISGNSKTCDHMACVALREQLGDLGDGVILLGREHSAPELKAIIGRCEFFVGSRMHACMAALSMEVPLVPLSYSHKFAGIMNRFEVGDWVADPKVLSQKQIVDLVLSGYQCRDGIKGRITAALPVVRSDAMRAGQLLKMVIS